MATKRKSEWRLKLNDIFGKNEYSLDSWVLDRKAPFALICPGGGYSMVCSFVEGRPFAKKLNEMGYSAFILRYHTREKSRYPAPQEDVARALKYILDNAQALNVETEGFSIWGSSAGGHLAASFGTDSMGYPKYGLPKPAAMVLVYPVITMDEQGHQGSTDNHLGKAATPEQIRAASVQLQVTENYPPTFLWNSDEDTVVPPINSQLMADALAAAGVPCEYFRCKSAPHGSGLGDGTDAAGWIEKAVAFWEGHR